MSESVEPKKLRPRLRTWSRLAILPVLWGFSASCLRSPPVVLEPDPCPTPLAPIYRPVGHVCTTGPDPVCLTYEDASSLGLYIRAVIEYENAVHRCPYIVETL